MSMAGLVLNFKSRRISTQRKLGLVGRVIGQSVTVQKLRPGKFVPVKGLALGQTLVMGQVGRGPQTALWEVTGGCLGGGPGA